MKKRMLFRCVCAFTLTLTLSALGGCRVMQEHPLGEATSIGGQNGDRSISLARPAKRMSLSLL